MRDSLEGDAENNIVTALARLMHDHKELDINLIRKLPASFMTIYVEELNKEAEQMKQEERRNSSKTFG